MPSAAYSHQQHGEQGARLLGQGDFAGAAASYRRALELKPDWPDAHCGLGYALQMQGDVEGGIASYRKALGFKPDFAGAWLNLGLALQAKGDAAQAIESYRKAIEIQPDFADAHYNLGLAFRGEGRQDEAIASYRRAVALRPGFVEAYYNLGNVLWRAGRLVEAEEHFRRAVDLRPNFAEAHSNLGIVLEEAGQYEASAASCRRALEINPGFAEAHYNLGIALWGLKQVDEALASLRRALVLKPDYPEAYNNLGALMLYLGRHEEAEASYRRALAIRPDWENAHSNLIFAMDLSPRASMETLFGERREWEAIYAASWRGELHHGNTPEPGRQLRVGYVSADFRVHSAARVFGGLLTQYDGRQFEVYAYSNHKGKADSFTEQFRRSVTVWRDISRLSDEQAVDMIRADGIDILVDLSGHSAGNRLLVFARKPAPIQITAWGYATGTGLRTMDVFFTDPVMVPQEESRFFSEEVRYLPSAVNLFSPEPFPEVNALPAKKEGVITFGSCNRLVKATDETWRAWGRVLQSVPESRLLLKAVELGDGAARAATLERLSREGVEPGRVLLLGGTPWREQMQAYHQVDIALDPFPHGGGVTTMEGLVMGVPVVTLRWPTVAGRLSASIMTTLGLTDWIAESEEEYVALAVKKAQLRDELEDLRRSLRATFESSVIGDGVAYVRIVEDEYRKLWREWCAKQVGG